MDKRFFKIVGFIVVALLPILIFRDYTPDNELKYISIANQSIAEGNVFAFFNHLEPYADKPPLYLWFVILGKLIFGSHIMIYLSLLSMIPAIITAYILFKWVKEEEGISSYISLFIAFSSAFFLACSFVLRMDMLMTMFITLAIYAFYKSYKYKANTIMIPIYTFLAIFSKGAVGIMVPLMTIILFLLVKRELKSIGKYLGFKFWGVLVILCGAWFVGVYLDGGVEYLNNLLFHQTIDRAVNSFHHKEPFYYYLITYWYSIAPWSILAVLALVVGFKNKIIKSDTDKIFAIASLGTIVLMSCVSSKIVIYLLPAFPFLIFLSGKIIEQAKESGLLRIGVIIPALIFIVAFPLSFFADKFGLSGVELWAPLPLFTALMAVGGALSLVYLYKKDIVKGVYAISASLFITLFAAGFSMGSLNDMIGLKGACKYAESEQCRVKNEGGESLNYGYYEFKAGDNLDVYLGVVPKKISAEELQQLNNTIIFAKKRRIAKDSLLRASIEGMKREDFGNFAIVTIKR